MQNLPESPVPREGRARIAQIDGIIPAAVWA